MVFSKTLRNFFKWFSLLFAVQMLAACAAPTPIVVPATQRRAPTQSLAAPILDQVSVEDLRVTADVMARDLILQYFIVQSPSPPIIAIKPIENKTDLVLDPDIFQKTIRVKLMEHAGGRILFRDEASHQYTVAERAKQQGTVQIQSSTSQQQVRQTTALGQPVQVTTQSQTQTVQQRYDEVAERVADIDYFLTGLIYSTTEVQQTNAPRGMRYFQFQFRITDARTNIIMWEKEYLVKREGRFK